MIRSPLTTTTEDDLQPDQEHQHERRPHFYSGRFYDAKCKVCHLPRFGTDEIHSDDAIQHELERLWRLEDAVLDITGELFHRVSTTETNYFITHPLECRARGLHLCVVQKRMTRITGGGAKPLPPGEWRVELCDDDTGLEFHALD